MPLPEKPKCESKRPKCENARAEVPGTKVQGCPFACSFVLRVGIIRVESCWTRGPCVSSVPSVSSVSGARVSHFMRVKRVQACWLPCVSCVSSVSHVLHLVRVKRVIRVEYHACCVLCVLGTSLLVARALSGPVTCVAATLRTRNVRCEARCESP